MNETSVLLIFFLCICTHAYIFARKYIIDEGMIWDGFSMPNFWTRFYLVPRDAVCSIMGDGPFYFMSCLHFGTLQRQEGSFVCNIVRCHWNAVKYNSILNTLMLQCRLSFEQLFNSQIFHISQLSYGALLVIIVYDIGCVMTVLDSDGLVHERHNSSALAMELCLSCTNPLILLFAHSLW